MFGGGGGQIGLASVEFVRAPSSPMVHFTRRTAAQALGAAALFPAMPSSAQTGGVRVRRDVNTLSHQDDNLLALRDAIPRMKADDGPLGWGRQVAIHADMRWGHHHSWRFLAWHRMQLFYMERIVARVSGHDGFAMPYWNWADDRIPPLFFNASTPFYHRRRDAGPDSRISDYIGLSVKVGNRDADFLGRPADSFDYFFGAPNHGDPLDNYMGSAEQYGHNLVHLFVGGDMTNLNTSPSDPLFFFHHSNVDRIWAQWSSIWGDANYADAWKAEVVRGYVDADGADAPGTLAGDIIDTERLGYRYDRLGALSLPAQREIWPGQPPAQRLRDTQKTFRMERVSPTVGRIFIPPQVLASLIGAKGPNLDVAGFLQVAGNGYVVLLSSLSIDRSWVFKDDAVFEVPMGGMSMGVLGHRIQLEGMIPRNERALSEGIYLQAETKPLGHSDGATALDSFVIEYDAEFPFSA
jgi:hypothetical protein